MCLCIPAPPATAQITNYKILHTFGSSDLGAFSSPLAQDSSPPDRSLYGGSPRGGTAGQGSVFKLNPDGSGYTVLRSFGTKPNDGIGVYGGVTVGSDGWLYGTTSGGGSNHAGLVFKMRKDGRDYEVLRHFVGPPVGFDPVSVLVSLIEGPDGRLYGVSTGGGTEAWGTIFRINKDGTEFVIIHHFNERFTGAIPQAALVEGPDGMLYGTAWHGGAFRGGTVFKISTTGDDGSVLHEFGRSPDGGRPLSPLLLASDGRFYGLTSRGGSNDVGTVYWVDNQKNYAVILHFKEGTMGAYPAGGLIEGPDGKLYGTAGHRFTTTNATLFRLNKDGSDFEVMHAFSSSEGTEAGLMRAADGALFGMLIRRNEPAGVGAMFRLGHALGISASANAATLEITGIPGYPYLLQRSTNLQTWSTLTNIVLDVLPTSYQDPAPLWPAAFYKMQTP